MRNKTLVLFLNSRSAISRLCNVAFPYFIREPQKIQTALPVEPRRLTLAEQWSRLAHIIQTAVGRADEATRCHSAAALQLDLAQYGLITLVDELSAVMDMQGRRRRATVHVLEVAPARVFGDAIAA